MSLLTKYSGKIFLAFLLAAGSASAATFTVTNTNNSGVGSLRQAVLDANASAGSDTVVFDSSFNTPQTIVLATVITFNPANSADSLTITGPGANLLTIDGNNVTRILHIETGDQMSLSGITLTRSATGAAITNEGSLTVADAVFTFNNGGGFLGGAITHAAGSALLSVTNSIFTSNIAGYGGAIGTNGQSVTISNCIFTGNIANSGSATGQGGGAVHQNSTGGTTTISNSTFTGNAEIGGSGGGGALSNRSGGTMIVSNSIFTSNTGFDGGGAIRNVGIFNIHNSTFTGNSASGPNAQQSGQGSGGAILNQGAGQLTITDSTIIGNGAVNHGGGIYHQPNTAGALLNITNTTISNNTANTNADVTGDGGGLLLTGTGEVSISDSTISGNRAIYNPATSNTAGDGGGIDTTIVFNLTNSTVSGNSAGRNGGGIYAGGVSTTILTINSSTIVNNSAGGLVRYNSSNPVNVRNTIIANNTTGTFTQDVSGTIISQGYNLIKSAAGATIGGTTTGNIIGQDPQLGPLSYNGGATRTHALLNGSPAIDTADPNTFPPTDQRGIARPQDGDGNSSSIADIGAYERRLSDVLSNNRVDFDGDGKTDVSIFRPSAGEWWYLRSSDNGNGALQFGHSTDQLVPADYTGDGKADIAFFRPGDGFWFILRSEDFSFLSFPFGGSGDVPVTGDFDGDGRADPTIYRPSTNEWFILRSTGGTAITTFGAAGDLPVIADYDGDGKTDIAIYRPASGEWWIQRSLNSSVYAFQFGTSTDKPVPGDYTGDGKADAAFWQPSTGEWFILRSEDNSFYSVPFGASGDQPSPGDYDGDGKFDTAVFRPSNTTWYINATTAGVLIGGFGAPGDTSVPNSFVP